MIECNLPRVFWIGLAPSEDLSPPLVWLSPTSSRVCVCPPGPLAVPPGGGGGGGGDGGEDWG